MLFNAENIQHNLLRNSENVFPKIYTQLCKKHFVFTEYSIGISDHNVILMFKIYWDLHNSGTMISTLKIQDCNDVMQYYLHARQSFIRIAQHCSTP